MSLPIIFDTDPGIDDAMAILMAHRSPAIELLGLTTTFGNATIEQTTRNALLLQETFSLGCPVHQGAARPLVLEPDEPPAFVHGHDGLGDAGLEAPEVADPGDAVAFIIETLQAAPGEVTLVAVGRMTNLARALALAPEITSLVRQVVIMGGALGRGGFSGNVTPCAEANIIGDPHAAARVMAAPWPVTMVGLDVTMPTVMHFSRIEQLAEHGGEIGRFIRRVSAHYQRFYATRGFDGFPVHDASALSYLIAPHLYTTVSGSIAVVEEGIAMGQTILAPPGRTYPEPWSALPEQQACVAVDSDAVVELYVDTIL